MTVLHSLIIAVNLLVAVYIYIAASSSRRRFDPILLALIGAFVALALADFAMAFDGGIETERLVLIVVLDVLLLATVIVIFGRERTRSRRVEAERLRAELEREQLETDLRHAREDRELALRDRAADWM